jgi:hypothetical protein
MFDQIIKVVACRETGCYWYFIIIFAESLCKQQIFSLPQGVTTVHIFSSISAAYLQHIFSLPQGSNHSAIKISQCASSALPIKELMSQLTRRGFSSLYGLEKRDLVQMLLDNVDKVLTSHFPC